MAMNLNLKSLMLAFAKDRNDDMEKLRAFEETDGYDPERRPPNFDIA